MISVSGKKTIVETHNVEVNPLDVLMGIYKKAMPTSLHYIGKDGHWYKQDFYDHHKCEQVYKQDRLATQEEIEFNNAYKIIFQKTQEIF